MHVKFNPLIGIWLALIGLWAMQSNHRLNVKFNPGLALIAVLNNQALISSTTQFSINFISLGLVEELGSFNCFAYENVCMSCCYNY